MSVRSLVCAMSFAVMCVLGLATAQAETWDALTGWKGSVDETSTQSASDLWQYSSHIEGQNEDNYALLPADNTGAWWYSAVDEVPLVTVGGSPATIKMSTGDVNKVFSGVVLGWKSPISGTVDVSFALTDLDPRGLTGDQTTPYIVDGVDYWLFKAGDPNNSPLATGYMPNAGATGPLAVSNIAVSEGTMLYLQLGPHNHYRNDTTGVSFTITSVPEPASMVLLVVGLVSLLAYAWRKRR